jgi:hypothetical protein
VRKFAREIQTYATDGKTAQVITGYRTNYGKANVDRLEETINASPLDYMCVLAIFFAPYGVYKGAPSKGSRRGCNGDGGAHSRQRGNLITIVSTR